MRGRWISIGALIADFVVIASFNLILSVSMFAPLLNLVKLEKSIFALLVAVSFALTTLCLPTFSELSGKNFIGLSKTALAKVLGIKLCVWLFMILIGISYSINVAIGVIFTIAFAALIVKSSLPKGSQGVFGNNAAEILKILMYEVRHTSIGYALLAGLWTASASLVLGASGKSIAVGLISFLMLALIAISVRVKWRVESQAVVVDEVIARGNLLSMEALLSDIESHPANYGLVARLRTAIDRRRAAYAVALDLVALNPSTNYYSSIFKAAAKNILAGKTGIHIEFREPINVPELYQSLQRSVGIGSPDEFSLRGYGSLKDHNGRKVIFFQYQEDFRKYLKGYSQLIGVLNAVVGENVFHEAYDGLKIFAYCAPITHFAFGCVHERSDGVYLVDGGVAMRLCLASEDHLHEGYEFITSSLADIETPKNLTTNSKMGQDLAIFFSKTLDIPYEKLVSKYVARKTARSSDFMDKVFNLVKDEVKGQVEDAAIQEIADKFFGENADLVADLVGECMKERASEQLADVIAEFIVGNLVDTAIGLTSEALSS